MGESVEGDGWVASYWDDILHDFGVHAYVEGRYTNAPQAQKEDRTMSNEFTANITGVKEVEVALSDIIDAVENATEQEVSNALSVLDDYEVDSTDLDTDFINVRVSFSGSLTVELDEDDLAQLVRDKVTEELGSDFEDLDVEVE